MRRTGIAVAIAVMVLLVSAVSALAISNGEPDNGAHPYVALIYDYQGGWVCSGAAISPTVLVTAAHCFDYQDVWVTFNETPPPFGWVTGTWYPDPEWCIGCAGGLPGFDTHDVAVVVLDSPVDLLRYASLPAQGLVDTLSHKAAIDIVGYGVQFTQGGGPRIPYDGAFTRYRAVAELFRARFVHSDEFIRLTANPSQDKGGICFGDSGGPDLIAGTDVILAVNSYVTNGNCAGVTYSNRIDTPDALEFIGQFTP